MKMRLSEILEKFEDVCDSDLLLELKQDFGMDEMLFVSKENDIPKDPYDGIETLYDSDGYEWTFESGDVDNIYSINDENNSFCFGYIKSK